MAKPRDVRSYITAMPRAVRNHLNDLRAAIRQAAPDAEERISYGMPYYAFQGRLAYFKLAKHHIGLYIPTPVLEEHKQLLKKYYAVGATLRLPLDEKIPAALVKRLIRARMKKNEARRMQTSSPIDLYTRAFPDNVRRKLEAMRRLIRAEAPQAQETISYQMPTFTLNGNLVHYAAHENHIGFYPTPSAIREFEKQLAHYTYAKGSVRFPMNEPLPASLIRRMVRFRVAENSRKTK